jgi:phosphatidate cytidylyltransferase
MLKQRVITAVVLLAILLPALFASTPVPFALLMLAMWRRRLGVGASEWSGAGGQRADGGLCLALCGWLAAGWLARNLQVLWIVAGAAWVLGGVALLRAGVAGWPPSPQHPAGGRRAGTVAGLAGVVQARAMGINFLLSVWCWSGWPTSLPTSPVARSA